MAVFKKAFVRWSGSADEGVTLPKTPFSVRRVVIECSTVSPENGGGNTAADVEIQQEGATFWLRTMVAEDYYKLDYGNGKLMENFKVLYLPDNCTVTVEYDG